VHEKGKEMTDAQSATIRVADHVSTGQDRVDGPALLDVIRAGLDEHGAVRLSFEDVSCVTPTLLNEAMVPLLDGSSIETLRQQVVLVDATRHVADMVRRCMEHAVRWNAGEFVVLDVGARGASLAEADVTYEKVATLDGATLELLLDVTRDIDGRLDVDGDSAFERMMGEDRSRRCMSIRCSDVDRDMARFEKISVVDLPPGGYDHRAENARWNQGRGRRGAPARRRR
jgi:hypothetical protein